MIGKNLQHQIAKGLAFVAIFTGTFTVQAFTASLEAQAALAKTSSSVNFRVGPSNNYTIIRKLAVGSIIDVISHNTAWSKVIQEGTTGYLSTKYITFTSVGSITGQVNLRSWGSTTGKILTKLPAGTTVMILAGPVNGWYKVIGKNLTGYVYKNYIKVDEIALAAPNERTIQRIPIASENPMTTPAKFNLASSTAKYLNAADAKDQKNSIGTYGAGSYYIFKTFDGMHNISTIPGQAGAWINPMVKSAQSTDALQLLGSYEGYTKMTWNISFYTNLPRENGGYTTTALGTQLRYGVLSSNYWPLRSQIILPDWGNFTVEDRGGPNFDSKYRFDMLIPRNSAESDYEYLSRVNNMGIRSITGYIKPAK